MPLEALKDFRITVRLDTSEYFFVLSKCLNKTKSEFIRELIRDKEGGEQID